MNKTININIGGYPFIIDDEAYDRLNHYLKALERHFSRSQSQDEILSDIESRIAEIFQKNLSERQVVEELDVIHAIEIMGTPDDFQDEDYFEPVSGSSQDAWQLTTGKKLFRDPDDQVIGGVCSGVAAYFGIQDPIWVRIGFAVVFFTMGFGLLLYLIMWAIVPEAKTASDRLAMRGEPVNVNNIANNIESGLDTLTGKIQEISSDFRKKKSSSSNPEENAFRGNSSTKRVSILNGLKGAGKVIRVLLFIIAVSLLIALFSSWVAALFGALAVGHVGSFILPWEGILSYALIIPFIFIVGVPIFSIARTIMSRIRPNLIRKKKNGGWVSTGIFSAGIVALIVLMNFTALSLKEQSTIETDQFSFSISDAPLEIDLIAQKERKVINIGFGSIGTEQVSLQNVELSVAKSPDDQYHLIQRVESRGATQKESRKHARDVKHRYQLSDHRLKIDEFYSIQKPNKWRNQIVKLEIQVPEDGQIVFDRQSLFEIDCDLFPEHELHRELDGHTFIMGAEKLAYLEKETEAESIGMEE